MHLPASPQPSPASVPIGDSGGIRPRRKVAASAAGSTLRTLLIDVPLTVLFVLLLTVASVRHAYNGYVTTIMDSLRRGHTDSDGFYPDHNDDFTYYNRQCDADDISTTNANDLLIPDGTPGEQAADTMMKHGAVVFKNVLTNSTASTLRTYLESRHSVQSDLPWHEKFFEEEDRLALGLGAHDSPIVTQALKEVGTNPTIQRTLEAILGPDPAIVEISTMTSMAGADDQGIHTDSDYFGSSLLYARNYLHSYTMFVALQDTTSEMGATTLCPGSHRCANEDMELVCLENGAFEASSNGRTGRRDGDGGGGGGGVLLGGDAMMFNQNIWHRGAANDDPSNPNTNRVMFILTFASRTRSNPSDFRHQALGTYYYQRYNTWGHTYADLRYASTLMVQPLAALRSFGLWKVPGSRWGITWIEQMGRELANGDQFYDPYELEELVDYLDRIGFPDFLRGEFNPKKKRRDRPFERFIGGTLDNVVVFLVKVNAAAVGLYLGVRMLAWLVIALLLCVRTKGEQQERQRRSIALPPFLRRIILTHGTVALAFYLLWLHVNQTELVRWATSGQVFVRPFPDVNRAPVVDGRSLDVNKKGGEGSPKGPTTVPERSDVLIGTRFDSSFLASYDRTLDYHPGNQRFHAIVDSFLPSSSKSSSNMLATALQDESVRSILSFTKEPVSGVPPRILLQDPWDGTWSVMSDREASKMIHRTLLSRGSASIDGMGRHLRSVLAEGRFGKSRDTVMSRRFVPIFVEEWEDVIYDISGKKRSASAAAAAGPAPLQRSALAVRHFAQSPGSMAGNHPTAATSRTRYFLRRDLARKEDDPSNDQLGVGDRVYGMIKKDSAWADGTIRKIYSDDGSALVRYQSGHYVRTPAERMRRYEPLEEGDAMEVRREGKGGSGSGNGGSWIRGEIVGAHPIGSYDVAVGYGRAKQLLRSIKAKNVRKLGLRPVVLKVVDPADSSSSDDLVVGEGVEANYRGRGEWFRAHVYRDNGDGTYDLYYEDGDEEVDVPRDRIRYYD